MNGTVLFIYKYNQYGYTNLNTLRRYLRKNLKEYQRVLQNLKDLDEVSN